MNSHIALCPCDSHVLMGKRFLQRRLATAALCLHCNFYLTHFHCMPCYPYSRFFHHTPSEFYQVSLPRQLKVTC